ncbi:hypothetical protein [Bacillus bingmayongensis]|uniref:hypothetical protein n=1 Tax=Bacillus bingmayongensis TaxID=1150157 RepID=UPI001C8D7D3C|nr:hypothetical protein [Bacillus bingmayongensis]MBY0595913.1 hypothetical protein [Bacillus bingmayongensis]
MENISLPIGTKHGCFTIIDGFEAYQKEKVAEKILRCEQEKKKFIKGEKRVLVQKSFDRGIETYIDCSMVDYDAIPNNLCMNLTSF